MPTEWAVWLSPCRDKGVTQALQSLGINTVGDLFLDGTAETWEEVAAPESALSLLHRFQFHRVPEHSETSSEMT